MAFGKIKSTKRALRQVEQADAEETQPALGWPSGEDYIEGDILFGGRDWSDLSILVDCDTPLGRAVRVGQCYFSDEDLSDAIHGRSRTVILTTVDHQPMFLNAAMISDVMAGVTIEAVAG